MSLPQISILPVVFLVGAPLLLSLSASSAMISEAEADVIVGLEMAAQTQRQVDRRAELFEVPAEREWRYALNGQLTVFRQVRPPLRNANPGVADNNAQPGTAAGDPAASSNNRKSHTLTLFVTVLGDELTEIRLGPPRDSVTVLSNVPLTYWPAFQTVETDDASYSFVSFVSRVEPDSTNQINRADSSIFSSSSPEYVVFADSEAEVSPDLLDAIDALHRHYLQNASSFEAQGQRAEALQAARDRHPPPTPREIVINFWPTRSREMQ